MSKRNVKIDAGEMSDLKAWAEVYIPALDDVADMRHEDGDRYGARTARELANVWIEIAQLADESRGKAGS